MTPPARLSGAMEILDRILNGEGAEQALTHWGRANRFAGSGDRHAIRDLVFAALRCKRSYAAIGGALTGRGLILGHLRREGTDPQDLFTGTGHAPSPLSAADAPREALPLEALDCPDWLGPQMQASLGENFAATLTAMQHRAPTFLRVNGRKATPDAALTSLTRDGIIARTDSANELCLEVLENARKINISEAYLQGLVELQDLSSQSVVLDLPLKSGDKVLDYCAGGGGKSLAMAARVDGHFHAYDHFPNRLKDLPLRAQRAGVEVAILADPGSKAPYDLVLCDAPCSGSGSWRRDPQGKWALTPEKLLEICGLQAEILDHAAQLVQPEGALVYVTCSVLQAENENQVLAFESRHPDWRCEGSKRRGVTGRGDGFFAAQFRRLPGPG